MDNIEIELDKIISDIDNLENNSQKLADKLSNMDSYHTTRPPDYTEYMDSYSKNLMGYNTAYTSASSYIPTHSQEYMEYMKFEKIYECIKCGTVIQVTFNEYTSINPNINSYLNIGNYSNNTPEYFHLILYCIKCGERIRVSNIKEFQMIGMKVVNFKEII